MKTYLRRMAKYFFYFIGLATLIFVVMSVLNATPIHSMKELFGGSAQRLFLIILVFSAVYPKIGYVSRTMKLENSENQTSNVEKALSLCDYVPVSHENGRVVYRGETRWVKLRHLYEDEMDVDFTPQGIVFTGPRKEVVKAIFRVQTFMNNPVTEEDK